MSAEIKKIYVPVYQGFSRRYFTKHAAARNIAKHLMDEHCYCDGEDYGNLQRGVLCKWHQTKGGELGNGYPEKRLRRIIKWILKHQPAAQERIFTKIRRKEPQGMNLLFKMDDID